MTDYSWIQLTGYFHLVAGIQGLFLATILSAYPAENQVPNRFLALFILGFSIIILGVGLGATGLYSFFPHLIRLGAPFLALLGPALLFYITAIRIGNVPSVQYIHLVPFILYSISLLPFYFSTPEEKIYWIEVAMTTGQADAYINLVFVTHFLGYLLWIYILLIRHSGTASSLKTDLKESDLGWIRSLTSIYVNVFQSPISTGTPFFPLPWMPVSTQKVLSIQPSEKAPALLLPNTKNNRFKNNVRHQENGSTFLKSDSLCVKSNDLLPDLP